MSYRNFEFPVNLKSVKADFSRQVEIVSTSKKSVAKELCKRPAVISGSGCFTGRNASERANMLMILFQSGGASYLFSPLFPPMRMFFTSLKISASSGEERIDYSLSFTQETNEKRSKKDFPFTLARKGENYFDVANRCEKPLEDLVDANTPRDLFSLNEGDKIWLK